MDKISKGFEDTILSSFTDEATKNLTELVTDISEVDLDLLVKIEIIKELPVIKTILTITKVIKGISSYLLMQKIIHFLFQLKNTTLGERQKFLENLDGSRRKEILSNLVFVLDKHDHLKKSEIQGKLFSSYIKGLIDYREYMSLTYAVNMMDITTFPALIDFYVSKSPGQMKLEVIYNFMFLQLIRIDDSKAGTYGYRGPQYKRNRLGMLLVEIGTEVNIPDDDKNQIIKEE